MTDGESDDFEAAMALLRRHRYGDVADRIEAVIDA